MFFHVVICPAIYFCAHDWQIGGTVGCIVYSCIASYGVGVVYASSGQCCAHHCRLWTCFVAMDRCSLVLCACVHDGSIVRFRIKYEVQSNDICLFF